MSISIIPAPATTNLHSPGPIGDVTPGTGAFTALASTEGNSTSLGPNFVPNANGKNYFRAPIHFFHLLNGSTGAAITPDTGKLIVTKADGSADIMALQAKLTTDTAALTGLEAGAIALASNASLVLYDANGVAYDVPCQVHSA